MRRHPTLKGPRVLLRQAEPRDKQSILAADFSDEYRYWVNPRAPRGQRPAADDVDLWYDAVALDRHAWVIDVQGRAIGSAALIPHPAAGVATYSIGIVDRTMWNRGFGTETTRLVLDYAFRRMHMGAVGLNVRATNRRAIACYTKCGFVPLQMERDGGRSYLVMGCRHPRLGPPDPASIATPELVIRDVKTIPRTGRLTLRPLELAYLGIEPGTPVASQVEGDAIVVRPAPAHARARQAVLPEVVTR